MSRQSIITVIKSRRIGSGMTRKVIITLIKSRRIETGMIRKAIVTSIRNRRIERVMTQQDLAEKVGMREKTNQRLSAGLGALSQYQPHRACAIPGVIRGFRLQQ